MASACEHWSSDDELVLEPSSQTGAPEAVVPGVVEGVRFAQQDPLMAVVDTERAGGAPESKRARLATPPQEAGEASGGSGVGAGGVEGGALLPSPVRTPPVCAPHSPLRHPHSPLRLKPGEEPVAEAAVGKALTVATLNLWATDRQTEETRKRRGHAAAEALMALQPQPDVICLQEAMSDTLEPIFALLRVGETGKEGVLSYVSVEPWPPWPWVTKGGNNMLVRSDLAITEARSLKYDYGGGRAMLAAKIELSSSQHVWVAATHLSAPNVRRAGEWKCRERQSQAKEALRALDYLFLMGCKETAVEADAAASDIGDDVAAASAGCGLAANADLSTTTCAGCILAGDLNWSEARRREPGGNYAEGDGPILSDEQRDLGWLDVWPALHETTGEHGFTFDTRRNYMLKDWLGDLGVYGLRLDRVLARLDPAALKPAVIQLFADKRVQGPLVESHRKDVTDPVPLFVSDHFGVVACFHPPGAGGPCGAAGTQTPSASPSSDDKKYSTQWSTP